MQVGSASHVGRRPRPPPIVRVISATIAHAADAALNWLTGGHSATLQERMPLLSSSTTAAPSNGHGAMAPSSAPAMALPPPTKLTSPPPPQGTNETASPATDLRRKRLASPLYPTPCNDETIELISDVNEWKLPAPTPRWRLKAKDILYMLAVVAGMMALGLIFPHHGGGRHASQFRSDGDYFDSDDSDATTTNAVKPSRHEALQSLLDALPRLRAHEERRSVHGQLHTTLRLTTTRFTDGPIAFTTRAYDASVPGPLWRVQPGDTIHVDLINELDDNVEGQWTPNTYHKPNTSNLHVHGMHVDPTGLADNVFRSGEPGTTLQYKYDVPRNHPRGLYHYHPHAHGSIFLQMAGGMAGPILVDDDVDTLPQEYKHIKQHVLVMQEFRFDGGLGSDLRQANAAARSKLDLKPVYTDKTLLDANVRDLFPKIQVGSLATDIPLCDSIKPHFAKKTPNSKRGGPDISRYYVVNGQYLPKIEVQPRENVLLRILNAGVSATLELSLPGCTMHQIAADGMYLVDGTPRLTSILLVSPGARADIVINCQPNDAEDTTREPLRPLFSRQDESLDYFVGPSSDVYEGVVAFVHVSGASRSMPVVTSTPPPPALYANGDLRNLADVELAKLEPFTFEFSMTTAKTRKDGFLYKDYLINHAPFEMKSIRDMPLDGVQEWVVVNQREEPVAGESVGMTTSKNHPFHLHTNAFQIIAMTHGEGIDYKVGDWRDVIAVPTPGNVTIRFRPVDFKGPIVAHCHIASHSDAGMVARVDIV